MPHSYRSFYLHIIFHVKERTIHPDDVSAVQAYMSGVFSDKGCSAISIGGTENHVHILAAFPLDEVGKIIGTVKTSTNHWLKRRNNTEYAAFSWQRGYGLFSVSYSLTHKVREYIMNQREHHSKFSAQDEFKRFLELNGLEYCPEWE